MGDHEDSDMHIEKPRLLPSVNYGAILQAATYVIGLAVAAMVVVFEIRGQQAAMLERMGGMQEQFETSLGAIQTQFQDSLTAQVKLMDSRVDLVRAELEGQIRANEARIGNQERLLGADIARIREMLEDLTDRLDRQNPRVPPKP